MKERSNPMLNKCFAHFRGKREPHPCLPVAKANPRKESILVQCSGRVSIHTADTLRYRHPAFVPHRRDSRRGADWVHMRCHDAVRQTPGAGNEAHLQCGYWRGPGTRPRCSDSSHSSSRQVRMEVARVHREMCKTFVQRWFFPYSSLIPLALHCCRQTYALKDFSINVGENFEKSGVTDWQSCKPGLR